MISPPATLWGCTGSLDMLGYDSTLWSCIGSLDKLGYDGTAGLYWVPGHAGVRQHTVGLYWVPGQAGVRGKVIADRLARDGSVHKFVGPEPSLGVSRQNIKHKDKTLGG
jgi:hypothetical protein